MTLLLFIISISRHIIYGPYSLCSAYRLKRCHIRLGNARTKGATIEIPMLHLKWSCIPLRLDTYCSILCGLLMCIGGHLLESVLWPRINCRLSQCELH